MNESLITSTEPGAEMFAAMLEEMAARIRRNASDKLGGCFIIIPPKGGGEPFSYLGLDSMEDPTLFYQLLSSRVKATLEQIDAAQRQGALRR